MYHFTIIFFFLLLFTSSGLNAQITATKLNDIVVDSAALTIHGDYGRCINGLSFQQDAVVSHHQYQYAAYYNAERHVCLARRNRDADQWQIIRFDDYTFTGDDAHNAISLGICPLDGTIHLAFDHHTSPLHYRVSVKEVATNPEEFTWNANLFGPVLSELETGKSIQITYPRFFQIPEGSLQFCYRQGVSGNGHRFLLDYNANTGEWENSRQIDSGYGIFKDAIDQSPSRCSYPNGYTYGPYGNLHTTWVWRESTQGANHDLIYVYSKDKGNTWLTNSEHLISGPPRVDTPDITVVNISRQYGLMNTHGQAVDSDGRIHTVMWHCTDATLTAAGSWPGEYRWGPPDARRYHHYWRDSTGVWHHNELPWIAGNRPKLFMDRKNNTFLIYSARDVSPGTEDQWPYHIYDLIIASATADSQWTDWKIIHVEKGPFLNEMLGDLYRWQEEEILSVLVQEVPTVSRQATPLRILDFSFKDTSVNIPEEMILHQNYPNPFSQTTWITYALSEDTDVRLTVYDILGREMIQLIDQFQTAGDYTVPFHAHGLSSGVYLYRLKAGKNHTETGKMLLL